MPETGEDVVVDKVLDEDADESETTDVVVDQKLVEVPKDEDDTS